jgi:sugar/nucleoside kinase (ribokinase family)
MGSFAVIGHVAIDRIVFGDGDRIQIGGPPTYAAVVSGVMNRNIGFVTKAGEDLTRDMINRWNELGLIIQNHIVEDGETTTFSINYRNDEREMKVESICEGITPQDIHDLPDTAILSPIIGEVPAPVASEIRTDILALDPQGYLRKVKEGGIIALEPWFDEELLRRVTIFKASGGEARYIFKGDNYHSLNRSRDLGIGISIITLGGRGALMATRKRIYSVPCFPESRVVDTTGAGDVFLTSFLAEYIEGKDVTWCGALGMAYSSGIVETRGPRIDRNEREIIDRADSIYQNIEKVS